jgi:hypothetical protein
MGVKLCVRGESLSTFFRDFETWAYLRMYFTLVYNTHMYKFYGLKVRRVCLTCYFEPKRVNLCDRETGIKRVVRGDYERSKSCDEIKEFFEDFVQFRKRKDLEDCIVDEWKRLEVPGLDVYHVFNFW